MTTSIRKQKQTQQSDVKEVFEHIKNGLLKHGFEKSYADKIQVVYSIGDNYFDLTKKFARFSILKYNNRFNIAGMVAERVNGDRDRVSRITWTDTAKVGSKDFGTVAMRIYKGLLQQIEKKV